MIPFKDVWDRMIRPVRDVFVVLIILAKGPPRTPALVGATR